MLIRNYFKIGKKADAQKFLKALAKDKSGAFDPDKTNGQKSEALLNGALQAFAEGRPENLQTAIANESIVKEYPALVAKVLLKIIEKRSDKLSVISLALEKTPDKQKKLDKALDNALNWHIGGSEFPVLLLKAKVSEFEKLPEQNGEDILRETLDVAIRKHIGSEDFLAFLLDAGLAKLPEPDKENVLSYTLNGAVKAKIPETFLALLLKQGAAANASVFGHPGNILVTATCNKSPMSVIELLHKNGASFDDALTTMHSQAYPVEDIDRLKFYREKLEGGKPARAVIEAATQAVTKAVTVAEPVAAAQGDVRGILLEILAAVRELTEVVKADKAETPAPVTPAAKKSRPYPSL